MSTLPSELWIMILDMVIIEGIVRLDQCDHTTFPYDHLFLSPGLGRYRFYRSYRRLRLVCRSFNALLSTRPYWYLNTSTFPFPTSIRTLYISPFDGSPKSTFQQLLADTPRCERLVCLQVSYWLSRYPSQHELSDFLNAGEGRAFPNVQRLTLWLVTERYRQKPLSFWGRLRRAFPQLVTLSIEGDHGLLMLEGGTDKVVTFERLEILYFGTGTIWKGCRFPRLRHASLETVWNTSSLEILRYSSRLECLLIRSLCPPIIVDVESFSRLHVLSIQEDRLHAVAPLDRDHPLEHLWLYLANISMEPRLIEMILDKVPGISRITMDTSSLSRDNRMRRIQEFEETKFSSFGMTLRPIQQGDSLLVVERSATVVKVGF
jgi:hypothetical protein